MLLALQIFTLGTITLAMALGLAHAFEMPGKMRLQQTEYLAVQRIYYPGFTIGGAIGEFGGTVVTLVLWLLTPARSVAFWLTLGAFLLLVGMQLVYWVWIHPINRYWLEGQSLGNAGARFFSVGDRDPSEAGADSVDWKSLRHRWECSHLARAVLAVLSFSSLFAAIVASR